MLLKVFSRVAVLLLTGIGAAALSGRANRRYAVHAPTDSVELAGRSMPVGQVAATYQPRMYLRSSTPSPALLWVWYEAVSTPAGVDLIYYHAWENEIHPSRLIHWLYAAFRAAYYGYPLYDIEYFQISVDRESGAIAALQFETSGSDDFYQWKPRHITERWARKADGRYRVVHGIRGGAEVMRAESHVMLDDRRLRIGAQTWNHLTRVLENDDSAYDQPVDAPLRYLTGREYRRYKFARRSQRDLPRL